MPLTTATMPASSMDLRSLAVPGISRASLLRRAAFLAGSASFAVAAWTLLSAIMVLG